MVASAALAQQAANDWTQAGYECQLQLLHRRTGITAANVASLSRHQINLDGTVDASAIYLHGVTVKGSSHNVFFVTTTYGKTIAVDADQGAILWEYTPPKYDSWAGSRQITNSTPVADPDRQNIYAAAPDGTIPKLAVSRRARAVDHRDHAIAASRKNRFAAESVPRPHRRRHRRLHRRSASLSGPRRDSRRADRQVAARVELALQRPRRFDRSDFLPDCPICDLGTRRSGD